MQLVEDAITANTAAGIPAATFPDVATSSDITPFNDITTDQSTIIANAVAYVSAGIGGDQADESMYGAGAVYIFVHRNNNWVQQAYVKASNPGLTDNFGFATAMSADGNTLAVSAHFESSGDAGIEADQNDNSIPQAGAVYVFTRTGDVWDQQSYIKPSNIGELAQGQEFGDGDQFGAALTLSDDGDVLAVSAITEDSGSPGINGNEADNSERSAGAVYIFQRNENTWAQSAYVKASNPGNGDLFGYSVALTANGRRLVVGSYDEDGSPNGTNEQQDDELAGTGAVYVFDYENGTWNQTCLLYTSPSPRDGLLSRMPSSA